MKADKQQKNRPTLEKILARLERIEELVEDLATRKPREDNLLTIAETSSLVKLAVSTIYSKVSRNEMPAFKIGKRLYFSRDEIIAWIRSGKIKTIAEIKSEITRR